VPLAEIVSRDTDGAFHWASGRPISSCVSMNACWRWTLPVFISMLISPAAYSLYLC